MKKHSDKSHKGNAAGKKRRPCLMAYTINNRQPVICTIIADQPYFYMEEEAPLDEPDILGFEDYAAFEAELSDMKRKMSAYEKLSKSLERDPHRRMNDFRLSAEDLSSPSSGKQDLRRLVDILAQSRMAKALFDFAKEEGVSLRISDHTLAARYEKEARAILIPSAVAEEESVLLCIRELRRHWQHKQGVMIHPLTFHPEQAIVINRAQMADLAVTMVRCAWELHLAGYKNAWSMVEGTAMSDLGRAFAREAFVDFRAIANGKACAAAFEAWFLSDRCRNQDKKLIQAMLADHEGYVFSSEQASRQISADLMSALGSQPYGKNYLAPYARALLDDPVFTEVRDRSNANFLWFIKFERSFDAAEQALQGEDRPFPGATEPAAPLSERNRHEQDARIIPHPARDRPRSDATGRVASGRGNLAPSNVIHVMFGRGAGA